MKPALQRLGPLLLAFAPFVANAEKLTLKRAVQLALAHSPAAAQVFADGRRAASSYREARNQYVPQLTVGSGLGGSWGYPLALEGSAPSLVNVTAQSPLINPALREYLKAARNEYRAAEQGNKDRHDQIVQDTVLIYLELAKWEKLIPHLKQQQEDAAKMEQVVGERIQQGVDSQDTEKQAKLVSARARLHIAQAEGAVDVLRATLSNFTGVPADLIETDSESTAELPEIQRQPNLGAKVAESSPSVLFAQDHAIAQGFRARAEHRALWPSVDFATQYAVLAKFNNWLQFFPTKAFERNNATVGVVIRFPFLNFSHKAHAEAADADAVRAKAEAQSTKEQVSQQVRKLQHSVEQTLAAQEVSELEYEIAQSTVQAVDIRTNSGIATVHDAANARTEMFEKYDALQDANFELLHARVSLMRATGELESWVNQGK